MFSGQFGHPRIIHSLLLISQTRNSYSSMCDTPGVARVNCIFWWWEHTQTECVPDERGRTHHFGHKPQNFENPICLAGYFNLKIECSSLRTMLALAGIYINKKDSFLQNKNESFLFMYIPANANMVHFAWHFAVNLVIFIKRNYLFFQFMTDWFPFLLQWQR